LPYPRVPDEQIIDSTKWTRQLFDNDPLPAHLGAAGNEVLRHSILDLQYPHELRELGMALFLDRPLGVFKRPSEPDQTPLLSYEMFSRSLAQRRLRELTEQWELIANPMERDNYQGRLQELTVEGIHPVIPTGRPRPGSVSLADAFQVASDFVALQTTTRSLHEFLALFDWSQLAEQCSLDFLIRKRRVLIVRGAAEGTLAVYDDQRQQRFELEIDPGSGYQSRAGVEYPADGLKAVRVWDEDQGDGLQERSVQVAIPVASGD